MHRSLVLTALCLMPSALLAQRPQEPAQPVTIVPQPETKLPLKHTPEKTGPAITAQDLMTRLYIYSDDSMQGRETGKIGNVKATNYIEGQVRQMGLVPAGDNGTYFQTIPFVTRTVDATSTFTVGGSSFAFGKDWAVQGGRTESLQNVGVVWGGNLADTSAGDLTAQQVAGKILVLGYPQGPAGRRAMRRRPAAADSAAAIIIVGAGQFIPFLVRPTSFVDDTTNPRNRASAPTLVLTDAAGARLFAQPLDSLKVGAAGNPFSLDLKVTVAPVAFPARNVVAILPGSDPVLKNEYVALGGHNDHIGMTNRPVDHDSVRIFNHIVRPNGADQGGKQATPEEQTEVNAQLAAWRTAHPNSERLDSISNGADDDGSGTVSVLEIAQKMASLKHKPKRSILFVWHVGEEKGLLGSAYFTDHPTVPRDSIVAQLNMDMVGRGDAWDVTGFTKDGAAIHGSPNYIQLVGSRRLSTELGDLAEKVNKDDHHDLTFDYSIDADGHPANIYCRSDHYEYARYGIPIIFFTTGLHSDYHQVTDEPEYIDYAHMARIDNYIEDLALHVADLDHRPVVDHPKPDPHGACRQ
ncbi:MAG TPA: M28 family peptidase [Gemmatimonadales bacterium]|nr:M28 family peptidase [Gemmatimonadales bacterium]